MAGITLAQAQTQLDLALAQLTAIQTGGTEFRLGDRMVKLPTLPEAQGSVVFWQGEVQRLQSGFISRGPRVYGLTPG
jgi:hypothetical protein